MALTDKLVAIADAIRAKSGRTGALTLDQMPSEIAMLSGSSEIAINPTDYVDYVRTEAIRVASNVRSVITSDSIVSICMSDSHFPADDNTRNGVLHALMAIKSLTYMLPVDFIAHLGDVGFENAGTGNTNELITNLTEILKYIRDTNSNTIPLFVAIGNHDPGIYVTPDINSDLVDGAFLCNNLTRLSAIDENTYFCDDTTGGGYCYRDFNDKKLRVFLLNTSERIVKEGVDSGTTETQRAWVASKLLELNEKSDASEWGFIVLCHYPLDYGGSKNLSNVFEAYVNGTSITLNGTSYNFSSKNAAKFIIQFHGHVHNFLVDKLYGGAVSSRVNGTPTAQYDAYRMAIPNAQYNRENYYYNTDEASTDGTLWGIKFFEGDFSDKGVSAKHLKKPGTEKDVSFVVNVINPSEEKIYSFCYGAGYDRVVGYGSIAYYSITRTLNNVASDNVTVSIEQGQPYSEIITVDAGCYMKSIKVTMGGVDVTSSVVSIVDGVYYISIPQVTANITITAKAQGIPNFTNLVPLSINSDGTDFYVDGDGYDNDVYISTTETDSGLAESISSATGYVTTGYIPVVTGARVIRIAGEGISLDPSRTKIAVYDENFNLIIVLRYNQMGTQHDDGSYYNGKLIDEESTLLTVECYKNSNLARGVYMRVCTKGVGDDLIVTVDEEIKYGSIVSNYTISYDLISVTSSNTTTTIDKDAAFYTTLTPKSGYEFKSVTVRMGGVDVTSSVYSNCVVSISKVIGNVVITAKAVNPLIANQLSISTDLDGNIYNDVGYKADTYISGGDEGYRAGVYTSGFIPVTSGATIYFENCELKSENSNHRFSGYDANKTFITNRHGDTTADKISGIGSATYDADGYIKSLTFGGYWSEVKYIRFCCTGLSEDSIVTVNEPID